MTPHLGHKSNVLWFDDSIWPWEIFPPKAEEIMSKFYAAYKLSLSGDDLAGGNEGNLA
jgi:hypothetical protein